MTESYTDTPLLTERFDEALHVAHRAITPGSCARARRCRTPRTCSPSRRSRSRWRGDEDEAIAALLHDVVEDGGGPRRSPTSSAGSAPHVAAIVLANSDVVEPDDADARAAGLVRAQARVHRRVPAEVAGGAAREPRRQAPQRALDPARLPHARRRAVGALPPGPGDRDAHLLPRARASPSSASAGASGRRPSPTRTSCAASSTRSRRSPRSTRARTRGRCSTAEALTSRACRAAPLNGPAMSAVIHPP